MGLSKFSTAAMALVFAVSAMPVQAAPLLRVAPGAVPAASSDVIQVQGRPCPPQGCRPGDRPNNGRPNEGRPGNGGGNWNGPGNGGPNRPGPGGPNRPGNGGPNWGGPGHGGPGHGGPNWNRPPNRPGHWNGHQGYRDPRPGYRRGNDGWWYPLAAFGVGALIGGAIANQGGREVAPPSLSRDHLRWCEDRYRSFRASDNTFQPNEGPRRACVSPYY